MRINLVTGLALAGWLSITAVGVADEILPRSTLEIGGAFNAKMMQACAGNLPFTLVKHGAATHLDAGLKVPDWVPANEQARLRRRVGQLVPDWADDRQVGIHTSLHMWKRNQHPNYPDASARISLDGTPYLIPLGEVPARWRNAAPAYRYSMSYLHPGFLQAVQENILAGVEQGVEVFEFQDALKDYYFDFSPAAKAAFRQFSQSQYGNQSLPDALDDFIAVNARLPQQEAKKLLQRQFPELFRAWRSFYLREVANFYQRLATTVREQARARGLPEFRLLFHEWILVPDSLTLLPYLDGIWAEVTPQISGFRAKGKPPAQDTYPPNSALAALTRVYTGIGYGKRVIFTPYGTQMGFQLPFKKGSGETLMQLLLAEIYASGGSYMHDCQGISDGALSKPRIQRMLNNLPATHFSLADRASQSKKPLEIKKFAKFLRDNAQTFDEFEPLPGVLVVKTDSAYTGETDDSIFGWVQLLDDARVPNSVLLDGSPARGTPVTASYRRLIEFPTLLLLGQLSSYSAAHKTAVYDYVHCGDNAIFVEDAQWRRLLPDHQVELVADLGGDYLIRGRPATLRTTAQSIFPKLIGDNLGDRFIVRLDRHSNDAGRVNLHLINLDYDWATDSVRNRNGAVLRLDLAQLRLAGLGLNAAGVVALGGPAPEVQTSGDRDTLEIRLSRLGAYSILRFASGGD